MEIIFKRLVLRQRRLTQAAENGRELLLRCCNGGAPEDELTLCRLKLKQSLETFSKELYEFLRTTESHGKEKDLETMTEEQLRAEDVLTELETTTMLSKSTATAKLPKLSLPSYGGDKLKWNEFWDRFKANVHNQSIADADKFAYLISCLTGTALETISGLATTDTNYSVAVETLEKRFGSKDTLIDAHYTAVNSLPKADYSSISCRNTLDTIERHLRILEKLGEPTNGNHLRAIVLSKFPEKVIHEHHLIGGEDNSMTAVRDSLHRIVTAMEKSSAVRQIVDSALPSTSTTEALHFTTKAQVPFRHISHQKRKHDNMSVGPSNKKSKLPCLFCKRNNHISADCRTFKTIEARKTKLKGRCHHCLRRNHSTAECRRKISCFRCKGDHLQILCPKQKDSKKLFDNDTIHTTKCDLSNGHTFLQTAVVTICNPKKFKKMMCRLLLDSGSQRSYITSKAANSLGLCCEREDSLLIYTFGADTPKELLSPCGEIIIETKRGIIRTIQVNIVPYITDHVPVANIEHSNIDILADDGSIGNGVDLLVGNDFYCSFLCDERIKVDKELYLINTDFGWILSGNDSQKETDILSVTTYCQCHTPECPYFTEPDLPLRSIDLKFLWSLESIGITDSPKVTRQEQAVNHFNETVQYKNGRYEIKWPWIQYPPELPSNLGLALGRLRSLVRRLDKDSMTEYNNILNKQLNLGVIEIIEPNPSEEITHPVHYLPHHMVKQKGKLGRIVYDASAKISGKKSLNECLYSGPSMLEDLTALLLQFRTNKIGIVADVEKAFLQVGLQKEDRDVTRFLWVKDINKEPTEDNLMYLRFCRIPFGVIASPFLLTATIRHHITRTNTNLLKTIADKCYVDNLVTGTDTIQEAKHFYEQTRSVFEELSMNIRDWVSNSNEFSSVVPEQHRGNVPNGTIKVLGLTWDVTEDTLKLKVSKDNFNPDTPISTKREVLKTLARVYDPCGFVSPLILPIKLLFQAICKEKVKWDVTLPQELMQPLDSIINNLKAVTEVELPRYMQTASAGVDTKHELHCFTDASKHAYAAVVYIRSTSSDQTSVSFVMAKSRISQIQDRDDLKIPKLELLGFLIGSRLLKYVKTSLDLPIQKQYLWTDSLVILGWMRSNKLLPPFIANRVNEIKRNHQDTEMYYVHTKSNPADIATRPESELWDDRKELWFNGPEFLRKESTYWPASRHYDIHKTFFSLGEALDASPGELDQLEQAEIDEDINATMEIDEPPEERHSSSQGENIAEIKRLQQLHFPEELANKKTHLARNLDLFLDVDGILRCRGRMANTTWSYDMKYPVLLPKDSEFTNQLIMKTHERNYHVGASHTLNIIRERYWIPQGKAKVVKILRTCKQCVKHGGGPYKLPATPSLPPERVNYTEPFSFTGVDYFGPMFVSSLNGKEKRWVALFTCLTVRAIHLEIVKDLSAEECLLALRRFAATRGIPKRMYSDNATCFKLTSEVMTKPYCIERAIAWKFIPQLAPWHGGFYERLVGLVKHCLKRTLEKHLLNESRLLTVIKEVEAVINSRPLTRIGTEVEHILRPADFLSLGKCLPAEASTAEIPCSISRLKSDLINSWRKGMNILEEFKKMFISQYLTSLRERMQHSPKQPRVITDRVPQIGDVVQVKGDSRNRQNWKVGKIVGLIEGMDGKCRVARVNVGDSVLTRSIGHLYPLEEDTDKISPSDEQTVEQGPLEEFQPEEGEMQTLTETPPICETVGPVSSEVTDTDEDCLVSAPSDDHVTENPEAQPTNEVTKTRRDAAIRARAKILEWTRQLLALLK